MQQLQKIGLGGGCHWCTEAVFQSLKGVFEVAQGFISSTGEHESYSEAVIVHYSEDSIPLKDIIAIHLHTHNSTSQHSMRNKYRSAIYVFSDKEVNSISIILESLQSDFDKKLITQVLPFGSFKASDSQFHDYYFTDPERPFCKTHIAPKLKVLKSKFSKEYRWDKKLSSK
jgi:peptide-methionine (S)-S-oxide reductase